MCFQISVSLTVSRFSGSQVVSRRAQQPEDFSVSHGRPETIEQMKKKFHGQLILSNAMEPDCTMASAGRHRWRGEITYTGALKLASSG